MIGLETSHGQEKKSLCLPPNVTSHGHVLRHCSGSCYEFYECPTKNVRVPDQMSNRNYKKIPLVNEKRNKSHHKEGQQQLSFMWPH